MEHYYIISGNANGYDIRTKANFHSDDLLKAESAYSDIKGSSTHVALVHVHSNGSESILIEEPFDANDSAWYQQEKGLRPNDETFTLTMGMENDDDIEKFIRKSNDQASIVESQLERFHARFSNDLNSIIGKIVERYESEEYKERWYRRGIEPPDDLYWFLFEYASLYGRECSEAEWRKHSNDFTHQMFHCGGYFFNLMMGQGAAMVVTKE